MELTCQGSSHPCRIVSQSVTFLALQQMNPPHDGLAAMRFPGNHFKLFVKLCKAIHRCPMVHVLENGCQVWQSFIVCLFVDLHQLLASVGCNVAHEFLKLGCCPLITSH